MVFTTDRYSDAPAAPDHEEIAAYAAAFDRIVGNVEQAVLGKDLVVRLATTCLLAEGHLLLEDYPGTGKTMLARALAGSVAGTYARIQFTPDLMPSDVTGVTVYDQRTANFVFHPGPIFHHLVLADEINRASPKTQSALLEVMEEHHATVDGVTHSVPTPFMVIATQNPIEQTGTYRLPEAQLDRFLIRSSVGYPDADSTELLLAQSAIRDRAQALQPVITTDDIVVMRDVANRVHVDPTIIRYVRQIAETTRVHEHVRLGLSPRGALALLRAAKAWAASSGRSMVTPQDVVGLAEPVVAHRLVLHTEAAVSGIEARAVIDDVLATVPVPRVGGLES